MNKIVSLDLSTKNIGWAVFDFQSGNLLEHGSVAMKGPNVYNRITDGVMEIFRVLGRLKLFSKDDILSALAIESSFFTKNPLTGKMISYGIGGAIIMLKVKTNNKIHVQEISPSMMKSVFAAKGKATKEDIQREVRYRYDTKGITEDEADAIGLGWTYIQLQKSNYFERREKEKSANRRKKRNRKSSAKKKSDQSSPQQGGLPL